MRTNQFNLTGLRLSSAEVRECRDDPERLVISVRSADRFGDNGLIGAIFARRQGTALHVDNMILSCRVFDRGVETAAMAALLRHARESGYTAVIGQYKCTDRNRRFADFYPSLGFTPNREDKPVVEFTHALAEMPGVPDHLRLGVDLKETPP